MNDFLGKIYRYLLIKCIGALSKKPTSKPTTKDFLYVLGHQLDPWLKGNTIVLNYLESIHTDLVYLKDLTDKSSKEKLDLTYRRLALGSAILNPQTDIFELEKHFQAIANPVDAFKYQYIHTDSNYNSFSQEGEDILLAEYFSDKLTGTYVEIGAYHPFRFSNTYRFYQKGWTGVCIDPSNTTEDLFKKFRPNDQFFCVAVGAENKQLPFYRFNEPALNTFDKSRAQHLDKNSNYHLVSETLQQISPLKDILASASNLSTIDFISIDVEGFEMEVLQSNDWSKYNPEVILIEDTLFKIDQPSLSPVYNFLTDKGYRLFAKTPRSLFFTLKH